jgi:hypothetical protein
MRILLALLLLCFNADVILGQAAPTPGQVGSARPQADVRAKPSTFSEAVADCEQMWDRGTHMSRKEWSQTCRRVQTRLQSLKIK